MSKHRGREERVPSDLGIAKPLRTRELRTLADEAIDASVQECIRTWSVEADHLVTSAGPTMMKEALRSGASTDIDGDGSKIAKKADFIPVIFAVVLCWYLLVIHAYEVVGLSWSVTDPHEGRRPMDQRCEERQSTRTHEDAESTALAADEAEEATVTPSLIRAVAVSSLGSLLFGFDTGVVSGALVSIGTDLGDEELSEGQASWLVSSALLAALLSSLGAARAADRFGRKPVILVGACLFALGAVEQAAAQVYREVILGRIIVGAGVGLASSVLPMYLSEISPQAYRGRIVASMVVLITGGQVLSYAVDAIFMPVKQGWRWMFGLGAVPAILQLVLAFALPESPRFQIANERIAPARRTLKRLHPQSSDAAIQRQIERMQADLAEERQASIHLTGENLIGKLWKEESNRRPLILACGLQFFQQSTGFNSIMYYSVTVLQQAGFSRPANFAILVAVSNFICTIIALRLIDHHGRRPLLLHTIPIMAGAMTSVALAFLFIHEDRTAGVPAYLALAAMTIFCCSYALGLGNVPWVVQGEVFSHDLRGIGNGLATAVNWAANLIVAATFLHISKVFTPSGAFFLYALVSVAAWVFTYLRLPETKGLSLEATQALFGAARQGPAYESLPGEEESARRSES